MQKTLRSLSTQALFDSTSVSGWFPEVEVSYIGGTRSNWVCAWTKIETEKRYLQAKFVGDEERISRSGKWSNIRKMRFFDMDGLNHVAHWDHPREFMKVVVECVRCT
ncbi:hypothetical protein C8R42DRAFT_332263 [Lentinula raphanica]|nr:hypothetical protein C8R42DRAFT_332263 [Lentinula raphanica]